MAGQPKVRDAMAPDDPTQPSRRPVSSIRFAAALVAVALLAIVGALVLGEYEFEGSFPLLAGPVVGLVLAEAAVAIAKQRTAALGAVVAALAAGSLLGAGWIDSGEGLEPMKGLVWVAAALAAAVGGLRAGWRGKR
jgi:hypothetical protein